MLITQLLHLVLLGNGDLDFVNNLLSDKISTSFFNFQSPIMFYKTFDIFVLPSRVEGFPLVPIEAMASGICTIRSDIQGGNVQISNGIDGYLFESENVDQLVDILNKLVNNEELRNKVAICGKSKAVEQFSSSIMANKTLALYKKLTASNN